MIPVNARGDSLAFDQISGNWVNICHRDNLRSVPRSLPPREFHPRKCFVPLSASKHSGKTRIRLRQVDGGFAPTISLGRLYPRLFGRFRPGELIPRRHLSANLLLFHSFPRGRLFRRWLLARILLLSGLLPLRGQCRRCFFGSRAFFRNFFLLSSFFLFIFHA
jgi:hypothetical protein